MHDIYVFISFRLVRMTIENNADRNVVCRKESLDSIQSNLRKRFDSESSVEDHEFDFDHLEPISEFFQSTPFPAKYKKILSFFRSF